jgi:hypothetical protein
MPPKSNSKSFRPNLKTLTTIIKQTKQQPQKLKPFDLVSRSEKKRRLGLLYDCLEVLSGGVDVSVVLVSLLNQHRLKPALPHLTAILHPQHQNLLNTIRHAHATNPDHNHKRLILSLLTPTFPFNTLKEMGFTINPRNYTTANKHGARVGPGQPVPQPSPPTNKRKMNEDQAKHWHDFLHEHSHEAANRTIKGAPVRYVEGSFNYLTKKYKHDSGTPFSLSTLRTHTPATFKRARRESDLCDYCESEQPIRKQLKQAESTKQQLIETKQDTTNIQHSIIKLKESIQFIESHQNSAQQQRQQYKQQLEALKPNECVVVFDFKENITVGDGPRETNRDFYSKSQRSVFLCTVYFKQKQTLATKANNKTLSISSTTQQYFHFISEVLAHDGLFVCDCITKFHELIKFRKFDTFYYWSDCGPHFRNYEVLNHTVFGIPSKFRVNTFHNFWGGKHGKSVCDSEFSVLSQWLQQITTTKSIKTTQELLDALREREAENKTLGGMTRTFVEYKRESRPSHMKRAEFTSIQTFHCFTKHDSSQIKCQVLSNSTQNVIHGVSFKQQLDKRKQKNAPEFSMGTKLPGRNSLLAWQRGKEIETGKH